MSARIIAIGLLIVASSAVPVLAQDARLEVSRKPQMIDCDGQPCFRLEVNAVDAQGRAVALSEATKFEVRAGERNVDVVDSRPLLGTDVQAANAARTRRVTLVLFDTSGSMNQRLPGGQTKFDMARGQLERLFQTFRDGVDQMAIAPFDSLQVTSRIRGATFQTTRAGLRGQVSRLRVTPNGNTALFSAVHEGLQVLKPRTSEDSQISLVVFTDGMNDVGGSADDPGLLEGPGGLETVTRLSEETGVTVYTVGYGAPGVAFDEQAMQALAYPDPPKTNNYFSASDQARLVEAFRNIEERIARAFRLFVAPVRERTAQLQGESLVFHVSAGTSSGESPRWNGTPLMTPPAEGTMTEEERIAWIEYVAGRQRPAWWKAPEVIRMFVLVMYSAVIALLWFGLPRVFWPERYIPKPAFQAPASGTATRGGGRGVTQPRATTYARPEVTISGSRGAARPHAPPPGRDAAPARTRQEPPPPAPRSREPLPPREASDATVYIPPPRKPGGD